MRIVFLLSLFFLISCASSGPSRTIASEAIVTFGDADPKRSSIKLFPDAGHPDIHHFYIELRNSLNALVDVELKEFAVKESKSILTSHITRLSLGRYEIEVVREDLNLKTLNFLVQRKPLKHQFVTLKKPVRSRTLVTIQSNENNHLKARVALIDKSGAAVEVQVPPEIIFMGLATASEPKLIKTGIWEFDIVYPEDNQIFYLSVRANGVLLDRIFRFQHVEK